MKFMQVPAAEGAFTSVLAAASPQIRAEPEKYKGSYMVPVGKIPDPPMGAHTKISRDMGLAGELWETSIRVLGDLGINLR